MNRFNFIIKKFELADFFQSGKDEITISFFVENEKCLETLTINALHDRSIYLNKKCNFSVYINFEANSPQFYQVLLKKIDYFIRLIFHPNFEKKQNSPVLFITPPKDENEQFFKFISAFETLIVLQGFSGVEWIYMSESDDVNRSCTLVNYLCKYYDLDSFENAYDKLLKEKFYAGNYFGIIADTSYSQIDILKRKQETEQKFKEDLPTQYALLEKYVQVHMEQSVLKEKLTKAEEDLKNQQLYLTLMRSEDEANKINNFYYYEYEILPSWYKKVGHVLKVIIGKRTFRSLFDNNIKKYQK